MRLPNQTNISLVGNLIYNLSKSLKRFKQLYNLKQRLNSIVLIYAQAPPTKKPISAMVTAQPGTSSASVDDVAESPLSVDSAPTTPSPMGTSSEEEEAELAKKREASNLFLYPDERFHMFFF
jgi:hypothetical protein